MDSAHIFWGECQDCGNRFEFAADCGLNEAKILRSW